MSLSRIQKNKTAIFDVLKFLHIRPNRRLCIYAFLERLYWKIKYSNEKYKTLVKYQSFCPSNFYYGHEYWLRKYSGFPDKIYAHIEHGVYFGDTRLQAAPFEEWEIGNFITFGESRIKLLNEMYPGFNVFPIGPRIHYAETDKDYYNELCRKIDHSGKVLTLYPAHSLTSEKSHYDSALFLRQADTLAERIGAKTIMISLHPSDYLHHLDLDFKNKNLIFVGGGPNSFKFLPRLRAIFELSDLTFSNALGTHVGYSIYMGIPHVMNIESNHNINSNTLFEQEQRSFSSVFNGDNPLVITDMQKTLCDYYFGYSHIKTPVELYGCLEACKKEYEKRYKRR